MKFTLRKENIKSKIIKYFNYMNKQKVPTVSAQLSWSHYCELLSIKLIDKILYKKYRRKFNSKRIKKK